MSRAGGPAAALGSPAAAPPLALARLPERPPISRPDSPRERVPSPGRSRGLRQPWLGLAGLLLVVPNAVVLAAGAGGDGSVLVLGPIVTYSLPLVAMVAFWWEDWPGTRLRPRWAGWANTGLIAAGAVVLTGIGQVVAGGLDLAGLFDPSPGPGHVPTFPATCRWPASRSSPCCSSRSWARVGRSGACRGCRPDSPRSRSRGPSRSSPP